MASTYSEGPYRVSRGTGPIALSLGPDLEYTRLMENNIVIAVIGGANYEGENFDTLRLFDSISKAKAYAKELEDELGVDYVLVKEKSVEQVAF